jgi:exonuclease III
MKFLAWNCRGLTRASAIRSLRVKVRNYSPDVLFLSETKTIATVACNIMNSLEFFFYGPCASYWL